MHRPLRVRWAILKDIQTRDLNRRCATPMLKSLREIAFEGISVAEARRGLTAVSKLGSGAVVFVDDGKDGDALKLLSKRPWLHQGSDR